jgi:putative oxidoreductase
MKTIINTALDTNARNWALLAPRLVLGVILFAHGAQKLFGWFAGYGLEGTAGFFENNLGMTPGILWAGLAGGGEFVSGILLILGLATRFGALTSAITMVVAIITVHHSAFFLPAGMEYVLALIAISIALLISGGGALSVDARLARNQT